MSRLRLLNAAGGKNQEEIYFSRCVIDHCLTRQTLGQRDPVQLAVGHAHFLLHGLHLLQLGLDQLPPVAQFPWLACGPVQLSHLVNHHLNVLMTELLIL